MEKACPVVLRRNEQLEVLVFRHPLAGIQLAKGTVEPGESSLAASERELQEEAGVSLKARYQLLKWQRQPDDAAWNICIMESGGGLPESWKHYCEDNGGHVFQFFWHSLLHAPSSDWHPIFVGALDAICKALVTVGEVSSAEVRQLVRER